MKKYNIFIFIVMNLTMALAYSATFVCPNTYKTIVTGYTIAQVKEACGKPAQQKTEQRMLEQPANYSRWIYTAPTRLLGQKPAQMAVIFSKEKVVEIKISHTQHAGVYFSCYTSGRIQVGSTANQVNTQCGSPTYTSQVQESKQHPVTVTQLTYNFGSYRPLILLTFENNKLTDIKMGQLAK